MNENPQQKRRVWTELALLLAAAVLIQSIRLLIPMIPGPVNMFLIGSLLNMVMVLAVWRTKSPWSVLIGLFLPVGAYLQGQLPLLPMLPVVALGNAVFILTVGLLGTGYRAYLAPFVKAAVLFGGTQLVLSLLEIPAPLAKVLTFMMSWPQIVTGSVGIFLAGIILRRIARQG